MSLNDELEVLLRADEGVRLKPYVDTVGKTTIGVGRNLTDKGLRDSEVTFLLINDISDVLENCNQLPWFNGLTTNRKIAVASMVFNLGLAGFLGFHNTISLIALGDFDGASQAMLQSKWAAQVGKRADRLAELMRLG